LLLPPRAVVASYQYSLQRQVLTNLNEHGNTSAGSIPIALAAAVKSGQVQKGDVIACAGFGAGLSWGAAVIEWG